MILVKKITKRNLHVSVIIDLGMIKCNLAVFASDRDFDVLNFIPDNINTFKQSHNIPSLSLKKRKKFFHQFIFYNLSSYNKFIYRVEEEIEEFRVFAQKQYVLNFGL